MAKIPNSTFFELKHLNIANSILYLYNFKVTIYRKNHILLEGYYQASKSSGEHILCTDSQEQESLPPTDSNF